jgi:3-hydroxyisobutyrate dehydrogenase-like beta-hydroxyacid dehydrogenase
MQAGFIGLGTMGASMAANLQKGLKARGDTLVVHDIRREAAARHVKDGAIWVDSPQAVAEQSEVIFTSLPGPPEFEAVAAGLLAGIKKGTAYFDLTTNSPTVVRKAHDAFAAKGVHLFDAPVSGGPRGAASGKLAIWCGGDADVFETWKPVLDMIGDAAQYIGPIGAGSVAKLVHNCFGYIATAAAAEVFSMGVKAGIEPLAIWEAVREAPPVPFRPDELVVSDNGVRIIGYTDLPGRLPTQSSQLFGTNIVNLLKLLTPGKDGQVVLDFDDVVQRGMTVVRDGEKTWPPPPVQVSAQPAAVVAAPVQAKAVAKPKDPRRKYAVMALGAVLFLGVASVAPAAFLSHFTVFALACVVGYYVIFNVTHALHTPLMSETNAISGIILVGALSLIGHGGIVTVLSFIALAVASINVFGGFTVTQRMLTMFRKA